MRRDGNNAKNGNDEGRPIHPSHPSHPSHEPERLLPPRGDYRTLHAFHKAEVVYDITFRFAHKFLARGDRTIDQMIQSARSGKKNILEGSKAGRTSKETEIKLTNVARASLEELLDDYLDFLRARDLPRWDKDSKEALYVRQLGRKLRRPTSFTASSWKPARPESWPTSRSASSTRPTTSLTGNSSAWRRTFSNKAACASA